MKVPQIALALVLLAFATAAQTSLDRIGDLVGTCRDMLSALPAAAAHGGRPLQARQALDYLEHAVLASIDISHW